MYYVQWLWVFVSIGLSTYKLKLLDQSPVGMFLDSICQAIWTLFFWLDYQGVPTAVLGWILKTVKAIFLHNCECGHWLKWEELVIDIVVKVQPNLH